jgi:hypothetical protein
MRLNSAPACEDGLVGTGKKGAAKSFELKHSPIGDGVRLVKALKTAGTGEERKTIWNIPAPATGGK